MSEFHLQTQVDVPAAAVVAVFGTRPHTWLHGFLRLATFAAAADNTPAIPAWYRLGTPAQSPHGEVAASFIWWPHLDGELFTRFSGEFTIHPSTSGTVLSLQGHTTGGAQSRNNAVLESLIDLLASAVTADQGTAG
jgi:hypothetical protein